MKNVYVMGINVSHDISCALLCNGQLVCAIAEERINRIKRYSGGLDKDGMTNKHLPWLAIQYCLDAAGIGLADVELFVVSTCVVVNYENYRTRELTKEEILEQFPQGVDSKKVHVVGHHLGHAASAYYPSEFAEAAILIADGGGSLIKIEDGRSAGLFEERITIYHGQGDQIQVKKRYLDGTPSDGYLANRKHCSLGDFYQSATVFVGFKGGDEGKTMGLAPYGQDRYFELFRDAVQFNNGSLSIKEEFQFNKWKGNKKKYYGGNLGEKLKAGQSLRSLDRDVAAAVQYATEEALIKVAQEAYEITGSRNLCLAGGVALNSVANKKILDRTSFTNIFVQPAAGDDGCSLGNAFLGWNMILGKPRGWRMKNAYTGRSYSKEEIRRSVEKYQGWVEVVKNDNVIKEASRLIADKNIVGWFQGGSEFGPRALGHRSILCDTRSPEMKDILNRKVKHREGFRPFAPSILKEYNSEYFELNCESPYMLLIAKVKKPNEVPAITHVDGTARVQTVTKEDNGIYYDLIKEYHKLTGVPVILNTSFNVDGEPIVETPEDAIRCFLGTQMDYLVLEDVILKKKPFKTLILKVWPKDIRRFLYKQSRILNAYFPVLGKIKKKIDRILDRKPVPVHIKVPG